MRHTVIFQAVFTSFLILTSAVNLSEGLNFCDLQQLQLSLAPTLTLMTVVKGIHGKWAVLCELCLEHTGLIIHVTLD